MACQATLGDAVTVYGLPGMAETGGIVDHEAGGFDASGHFGEFELNALELPNRLSELFAVARVPEGVSQGCGTRRGAGSQVPGARCRRPAAFSLGSGP